MIWHRHHCTWKPNVKTLTNENTWKLHICEHAHESQHGSTRELHANERLHTSCHLTVFRSCKCVKTHMNPFGIALRNCMPVDMCMHSYTWVLNECMHWMCLYIVDIRSFSDTPSWGIPFGEGSGEKPPVRIWEPACSHINMLSPLHPVSLYPAMVKTLSYISLEEVPTMFNQSISSTWTCHHFSNFILSPIWLKCGWL